MKNIIQLLLFWLITVPAFSQPNVKDSLKKLSEQVMGDTLKIDKLNQLIIQYAPIQPEIVLQYADTAIGLSEKLHDSTRISFSVNRKGNALFYLGDYNAALENYFRAISINEKSGNPNENWREYNNIGLVLRNLNQTNEALKYFKLALTHIEKTDDKRAEAIVWDNIGISYMGLKDYIEAQNVLEKAYKINQELGEIQAMAQDINSIGRIYAKQKQLNKAILYYHKALEINKAAFNKYEEAQNNNNLAEAFLSLKEYDSAKYYLLKTERIINDIRANPIKLNFLKIYSQYYVSLHQFEKAIFYKDSYTKMSDSIFYASRMTQFDQLKTLANTEKEIQKLEFLKKINLIQEEKIKNQKIIQIGTGLVVLVILFLLIVVLRNLQTKKKLNSSLQNQSLELSMLNQALQSTNEELKGQHEQLEVTVQTLKNTQSQLVQSEKMASLGVLAAGVAHEINNPLNFINGGITAIETYFQENLPDHLEEVNPLINCIQVGVCRAASIVSSLNHYSRNDDKNKIVCDIHQIINNCLVMLNNQIKDRIEVNKYYCKEAFSLLGNESKLHQAMLNILANAAQAIENEGKITITTKIEDDKLAIIIEDSGLGVSKENLEKIFDLFFTTKDPGKGTGLGLSITYSIIQEHNGQIELESEQNQGATVTIKLPVQQIQR